jgi:ABC-type multidrug transport system fused ATPase/permease subunit
VTSAAKDGSMSASPNTDTVPAPPKMRSRLYALLGDRRPAVAALIASSVVGGFAEAGVLAIIAEVASTLAGKGHSSGGRLLDIHAPVKDLLLVATALAIVRMFLQWPLSYLPSRIAADVQARLRRDLFFAYTRSSWDVQSRDREGHLQDTMTSQVLQATGGVLQSTSLIIALFTFLVLMISAFVLNVAAATIVLVMALLLFAGLRPLRSLGRRRARSLSKAQVEYAGGIGEAIRVAEETQVFGVAAAQRSQIEGLIAKARKYFFQTQLLARLIPNLYQSLIYLLVVVGLWILYPQAKGHAASLGAVVLLLIRAATNGQVIQGTYQSLQQSLAFIERLQEAERHYSAAVPPDGHRTLPKISVLSFEHVSFAYRPGRPILKDINFEVAGGESIGVIGPTGAGKSTLIQILLRLRTPHDGVYLVNGAPVDDFARSQWQRRVAYVPQEPRLLHATVADNIRYFRELDDAAVERAARLARIHDDIISWSDGYQTLVGPRADAVSGGQQQRICLARALVARPEVLVLDEPTSALDPHSEMLIQDSLVALKDELTLFIVAHRMSTLDVCNRVMVILDGELVAFDTTAALESENNYYRTASMLAAGASANRHP